MASTNVSGMLSLPLVVALLVAATACEHTNPNYCCNDLATCHLPGGSDDLVACTDPARPYCDNAGDFGLARTCIPDPSTTSCDGPDDCTSPSAPVCDLEDTGTCVGCDDAADCTRFAGMLECDTSSGSCVECLDEGDCAVANEPICGTDHACRACMADGECDSGVCDEMTGECVDGAAIVYVATGGSGAACTQAQPCGTIAAGIVAVDAGRRTILLAPGSYSERVSVTAKSFTLVGQGADLSAAVAGEIFDVNAGNVSVTVEGLRIHDGLGLTGDGVRCRDMGGTPRLALINVTIEDNGGAGINTSRCNLTVAGSRVFSSVGGGIVATSGGAIAIRNSFIARNGGPAATVGGVNLDLPTSLTFEFNTVADNQTSGVAFAAGVQCRFATPRTLSSNIVMGPSAAQVSSTNCDFAYTISNQTLSGTGNLTTLPTFVNAPTNDYHLMTGSAGINVADPAATLATDIDGQPRPQGGRADIGADEAQ